MYFCKDGFVRQLGNDERDKKRQKSKSVSCNSPIHLIRSEWLNCVPAEVTRWSWLGCVVSELVSLSHSTVSDKLENSFFKIS